MGQNLYMQTSTWLVSRELTEAAGPWDTRLLGTTTESISVACCWPATVCTLCRMRDLLSRFGFNSSLSYHRWVRAKLEAHWLSMQLHIGYLRSLEESERVDAACLQYIRSSLTPFLPRKR